MAVPATGLVFRQLFDSGSSTYTYIIGCAVTRIAAIIDPVYEKVTRDTKMLSELDLHLKFAMNTHCHADHVTGTAALRTATGCQTVISRASGAKADIFLDDNEIFKIGDLELEVRSTPGHTDGCISYILHKYGHCFTGDALMVRACGRTDFQQGCPERLFKSVHERLFTLPDSYSVYPAHDYQGRTQTSIGEEKKFNPRLTKSEGEFVSIMKNLGLRYPAKIDVSVPWNMRCGPTVVEDAEILADIAANKPPQPLQ